MKKNKITIWYKRLKPQDKIILFFILLFFVSLGNKYQYQKTNHIPVLIQPLHSDTVNPSRVLIHWNRMSTEDHSYEVQVSRTKKFVEPVEVCAATAAYECWVSEQLQENTTYYVRIRSTFNGITYAWSTPRPFKTSGSVPSNRIREFN
jgi:hypothetical protein